MVGEFPSKRTDHSVVLYEDSLYVYGGFDGNDKFGDLFKCKLRNNKFKWKELKGEGEIPLQRFGHVAVVYEHSMYIFGGWNGNDTMDDIY